MARVVTCHHAARVADPAAPILFGVTVEQLLPPTAPWHPNVVALANDRRAVQDDQNELARPRLPQEGVGAVVGVIGINPLVARRVSVKLVEGGFGRVEPVQVAERIEHAPVRGEHQQVPIQALVVLPFTPLRELTAHKDQFLARLPVEIAVEQAQVGELLPDIAGHFIEQRAFAVNHLVV